MPKAKARELAREAHGAMIREAREFHVTFYRGRDPVEDRGVVRRDSIWEVVEGFATLEEARAFRNARGADCYGRRGTIRAISANGMVGIHVDEDFTL